MAHKELLKAAIDFQALGLVSESFKAVPKKKMNPKKQAKNLMKTSGKILAGTELLKVQSQVVGGM